MKAAKQTRIAAVHWLAGPKQMEFIHCNSDPYWGLVMSRSIKNVTCQKCLSGYRKAVAQMNSLAKSL